MESDDSTCCQRLTGLIPARVVLGILAFWCFVVTQMLRSNLYIAMVAMHEPPQLLENLTAANFSHTANLTSHQTVVWEDRWRGLVLSAFYCSYWLSEVPGGVLAQRLGPRLVLGVSTLAAGVLACLTPLACRAGPAIAFTVRALQGLLLGVTWPAMHCMSGRWIPTMERSKFMSAYHGTAVGNALIFPLGGVLIEHMGWPWVFYSSGVLAVLWSGVWWVLVRDSPDQHPRLAARERLYLARTLRSSSRSSWRHTPWREIVSSPPCWAALFASQGLMWGTITLNMQLPAYFHQVHRLDIKTNGILSGLPDLCKFSFGLLYSTLTDSLLKRGIFSLTTARKVAVSISELLPALLLCVIAFYGTENGHVAAAIFAFSSAMGGASSSGSLANIVDLSPNFAGVILGLIKTLAMIPGVLSPIVASLLTSNVEETEVRDGWSRVFLVAAVVYVVCCVIFLVLGSGEVQPWNQPAARRRGSDKNHAPEERKVTAPSENGAPEELKPLAQRQKD